MVCLEERGVAFPCFLLGATPVIRHEIGNLEPAENGRFILQVHNGNKGLSGISG